MPKRIGYLYEQFVSDGNCILAERKMAKNKPHNRMAKRIGENAETYGKRLAGMLAAGAWRPSPNREFDLVDSYKGKTRHLKVPCLLDQSVQYAWLNVATPYIERRNYFYNCGSIPGAGQKRAVDAMKRWLKTKRYKYGQVADIYHFYDTCPHWAVMRGLRHIFKDERFLAVTEKILGSMSGTGIGLAIGHPSSHWFANVALMALDHELREKYPDVKFARYMDDYGMASNNKRHLRKARELIMRRISAIGMAIKRTWQLFRIASRGITFLSYRFFHGYTLLAKPLMYRIARRMRKAQNHLDTHTAAGVISHMGILKHCNSYNFRKTRVYPYVSIKKCKEVISKNAHKNNVRTHAAAVYG